MCSVNQKVGVEIVGEADRKEIVYYAPVGYTWSSGTRKVSHLVGSGEFELSTMQGCLDVMRKPLLVCNA